MSDLILLVIVNILVWAYVISALLNGRKIAYEILGGSKVVTLATFLILALLIFIRMFNVYGFINIASFLLAAAIASIIPSGFGEDAIILNGRLYPYKKIKDMDYEIKDDKIIINFTYKHKPMLCFATLESKDMVKAHIANYRKKRRF